MECSDNVDTEELALAMSTALFCPTHRHLIRRSSSFNGLGIHDGDTGSIFADHVGMDNKPAGVEEPSLTGAIAQMRGSDRIPSSINSSQRPIRILDRSVGNQNYSDVDGLWASSVEVTEPSVVKGNETQGLQATSGYVG